MKNLILPLFLLFTLNTSCANDDISDVIDIPQIQNSSYSVFTGDYTPDPNNTTSVCLEWNHPAIAEMRKRAELIGSIPWIPQCDVPKRNGIFPKGIEVKGIPYSSVKELDKFVGQEVSFYTFLTAVNNPKSVLYTENVGIQPYHGTNCAAYYGSVCSMAINYALGLNRPYETKMYGTLPFIKRVEQQDLEHAAPGDLIHFLYGHAILITDITQNSDGVVNTLQYLESTGSRTCNKSCSRKTMQNRLDKYEHVIYRYTELNKLSADISYFPDESFPLNGDMTNSVLSLSRGNKATYRENDNHIVINIFSNDSNRLEVFKIDNGLEVKIKEVPVIGTVDLNLEGLLPGSYKAKLFQTGENNSQPVFFEILQTKVDVSFLPDNILDIRFYSMNAMPEYIVFCKENGSRSFIDDIAEEERLSGHKLVKCEASLDDLFLKVFFRGEYGRVSNAIIPLRMDFATKQ